MKQGLGGWALEHRVQKTWRAGKMLIIGGITATSRDAGEKSLSVN